ncbi:expressed protein [Phakopsora pachyrhizi]|uniref:Expressed protein n=1 Tax=Phakopsora pachyrhizi TaxID=170000 RepID=A0AAV0BU38_PHAPC|nr:expressed protein [Phakopsora pachyrhizi]
MINHSCIPVLLLLASSFFTLFYPEKSGIILYASASHIPPDTIKIFAESSHPEGPGDKVIENLGNYDHNEIEMLPSDSFEKRPRDESMSDDSSSKPENEERSKRSRYMEKKRLRERMRKFRKSHSEISSGSIAEVSSQRSLPLVKPPSDEFILLERALGNLSSKDFIKYFTALIRKASEERKPGTVEEYDVIFRLFIALNRLEIPSEEFKSLGNSILSDKQNLNFLAIVVSKIVTDEHSYTITFQKGKVKEFLLEHPDLGMLHKLLTICDENHWKKIKETFYKAYLEKKIPELKFV